MTPPAATAAAARRAVAAPARPQRRVSGPARPAPGRPARPVAVPRPRRAAEAPAGARLLAWLRALPDHRLLHRLIGGRVWIVLLVGLLVGIVTMQLTLLRWNTGIGRAVEQSSRLEQRNAALRQSISELSATDRIVAVATRMGYVTPPQGSPRFLTASAADAAKALTTMRVPDPNAAALAAAELAASTEAVTTATSADPTATTTDPATGTTADPTVAATGTTTPATGTTDPTTTAADTTAAGTTAPVTSATTTAGTTAAATAGGASAPQG